MPNFRAGREKLRKTNLKQAKTHVFYFSLTVGLTHQINQSEFLHGILHWNCPRIHPVAFQWPEEGKQRKATGKARKNYEKTKKTYDKN